MKTKPLIMNLLMTLLLCLSGCSGDDAATVLASVQQGGAGGGNTPKVYNSLVAGLYEAYSLFPDGTMEYLQVQPSNEWAKATGTYVIDNNTNQLAINITFTEASTAYAGVYCAISQAASVPYTELNSTTVVLVNSGDGTPSNFVLESVSGITPPDISAHPDVCP